MPLFPLVEWPVFLEATPMTEDNVWPSGIPTVGQRAERTREVSPEDIEMFTAISGDRNPLHYDEEVARATSFGEVIVQGGVTSSILNAVVAAPTFLNGWGWWVALAGPIYLVSPGISAPDPLGALLMMISGIASGIYSLREKGTPTPVWATTGNFVRTVPMALVASLLALSWVRLEWQSHVEGLNGQKVDVSPLSHGGDLCRLDGELSISAQEKHHRSGAASTP